jgi:DNA-binding LacI/PurR family transcriptional regulator
MSKMFSKELTTIDQDIKSFASNAVASLVKQINGDKDIVSKNIIPCIMVNGETVKKIN